MNLRSEVRRLFAETRKTHVNILPSIAKAEEFLRESYEGRYFFELIQNARDANKALKRNGVIVVKLEEDRVRVSNTGKAFSVAGIDSICRIGMSDKTSQDFIGHKGYGFKSVQEITERPFIITRFGTIYFDKQKTKDELYLNQAIDLDAIPLFFFPHYRKDKLQRHRTAGGIDIATEIVLPFRTGVSENKVFDDFDRIGAEQLALLGSISSINFSCDIGSIVYQITKRPRTHLVEVSRNGEVTFFKEFQPKRKITIPNNVYQKLEKREKQLFSKDRTVEIKVLLEWDKKQRKPVHTDKAKLYLFYPLEITSGFRFLIHSYFSVNPQRKELRKTALNEFLLRQIADFLTGSLIDDIKWSNRASVLQILCFRRVDDSGLHDLYDRIAARLWKQEFLYDDVTKKFYAPKKVMIADQSHRALFPEGLFAGRRLIFVEDEEIRSWLTNELGISYLTVGRIRENIEDECRRQSRRRNIKFFQVLYNYVASHLGLSLDGKKVLLTENWHLVSSDIDVFYGGRRTDISIPGSLRKKITFMHKDISISDFREGRSNTGIIEFSTYALVTRLLKLFEDPETDNTEIVRLLRGLKLDGKSLVEIKTRMMVPIKNTGSWLNPLFDPVYFDRERIRELYPNASYVDVEKLMKPTEDRAEWESFLRSVHVWDVPALFIRKSYQLDWADPRNDDFARYTGKVTKPFLLENDRCIDIPSKFNDFFFESIVDNWDGYVSLIQDSDLPDFTCRSQQSYNCESVDVSSVLSLSHFRSYLRTNNWIWISGKPTLYSTEQVVAINLDDFRKSHLQVLKKYLNVVPVNFAARHGLLESLEIPHLSRPDVRNYVSILTLLRTMHPIPQQTKTFEDCFNRILGYLSEFYNSTGRNTDEILRGLGRAWFLAYNEIDAAYLWKPGTDIVHIDDKALYERMPLRIQRRLQPRFTNRDKNAFGRIAGRIGKVLSRMIGKSIVRSGQLKTIPLIQDTATLPILLALIENSIKRSLSSAEVGAFRDAQVVHWEDLKIRITLAGSREFRELLEVDYAVDPTKDADFLHIRSKAVQQNAGIKAQALASLFESIVQDDIKGFAWALEAFFMRPTVSSTSQFINDHDISHERIDELRDLLEEQTYSSAQQFWIAVLNLKNRAVDEGLLTKDTVDVDLLSQQINLDARTLKRIHRQINYTNLSDTANIGTLHCLFSSLQIKLDDFNLIANTPISFRVHHRDELRKIKNRFEDRFQTWLYRFLTRRGAQDQAKFQELLDRYSFLDPDVDESVIKMDYGSTFDQLIGEEFDELPILLTALREENRRIDISRVFYSNRRKLLAAIRKAKVSVEFVDEYLQENAVRSRLYFGFNTGLVTEYERKYRRRIEETARDETKHDYRDSLKSYYDVKDKKIMNHMTKSVDLPPEGKRRKVRMKSRRDARQTHDNKAELIGIVGELSVYRKILEEYPSARWVSRNAYRAGMNPEGEDGLGYDIEYTDEDGIRYYIEVKSKIDKEKAFTISQNEIDRAIEAQDRYMIVFVTNALDNQKREYMNLGNIFVFDEGEDFMSNSRFRAVNDEYRIMFK